MEEDAFAAFAEPMAEVADAEPVAQLFDAEDEPAEALEEDATAEPAAQLFDDEAMQAFAEPVAEADEADAVLEDNESFDDAGQEPVTPMPITRLGAAVPDEVDEDSSVFDVTIPAGRYAEAIGEVPEAFADPVDEMDMGVPAAPVADWDDDVAIPEASAVPQMSAPSSEESFRMSPTSKPGEFALDWTETPEVASADDIVESVPEFQDLFGAEGVVEAIEEDEPKAPIQTPSHGINFDTLFRHAAPKTMPAEELHEELQGLEMEQTLALPVPLDGAELDQTLASPVDVEVDAEAEEVDFNAILKDSMDDVTEAMPVSDVAEAIPMEDEEVDFEQLFSDPAERNQPKKKEPEKKDDKKSWNWFKKS